MKVKIKQIDTSLPLPAYQTPGSAALDLYARIDVTLKPFTPAIIPLNIVIKMPKGYVFQLSVRSSTPLKKGILAANGIGIIDQDYSGEKDEIGLIALNFTQHDVQIKRGDRIAQGMIFKVAQPTLVHVEKMDDKSRGGFGSTG